MIRTTGRARREVAVSRVRSLVPEDLKFLAQEKGSIAPPLQRLKDRHHSLARAIASGMSHSLAAAQVGILPTSLSILLRDPSFKELLEFYRSEQDAIFRNSQEAMVGVKMAALDEVKRRLDDDEMASKMSMDVLLETIKTVADRTGDGPASKTTNVQVNVDFGARLEAARKRVAERKLIDVTPEAAE